MKGRTFIIVALAIPCLAGCMPLSQAALVYSSAIQVGVKVAAVTPTNPGLQIGIGYEQLDAAYVPVAVARPCPIDGAATCSDATHPIIRVRGGNSQDNSDKGNENARQAARTEMQAAMLAQEAIRVRIAQAIDERDRRQQQLDQAREAVAAAPAPDTSGTEPVAPSVEAATIEGLAAEIVRDNTIIEGLEGELGIATIRTSTAQSELAAHIGANQQNRLDVKDDALSVFGSFNGNATASAGTPTAGANADAGLNLGKVFSTGVASQNITQGIGAAARANALAQCLTEARLTVLGVRDTERAALLSRLVNSCATTVAGR